MIRERLLRKSSLSLCCCRMIKEGSIDSLFDVISDFYVDFYPFYFMFHNNSQIFMYALIFAVMLWQDCSMKSLDSRL